MTKIAIAEEIAERIRSSEGPIELVDAQGQTIDHFFSFSQFSGRIGRNRQTTRIGPTYLLGSSRLNSKRRGIPPLSWPIVAIRPPSPESSYTMRFG